MNQDPSRPSLAHTRMARRWTLPRALMGGTDAMRALGPVYLPKHPAEKASHHQARIERAVLRNFFRRTVETMTGKLFARPLVLGEDVPPMVRDQMETVDDAGRHLNVFARAVFADALQTGLSHILVDYPRMAADATLADERTMNARPYAVHVRAEQLLAVQWTVEDGRQSLAEARIRETVSEHEGFEERAVEQIRQISRRDWKLWRRKGDAWAVVESGVNSLGCVPLATVYTGRTGFLEASPPLEDLAYMQLEHYQIRSDQRNALNVASFPILAASGYDRETDGDIEVGPNRVLTTSDPAGRFYYVESSGAALAAGQTELEHIERAMRLFGLQFDVPAAGAETATGRAIDAAEALSPLQVMAMELQDALETMLWMFARWQGFEDGGSVEIGAETGPRTLSHDDLGLLMQAHQLGSLSRRALLEEIKRRGLVGDDFDIDGELAADPTERGD